MTAAGWSSLAELRQRAELIVQQDFAWAESEDEPNSPEQTRQGGRELCLHKIELEMQNDELRRLQIDQIASLERYSEFYDLAPVGYCTVDERGLIVGANATASSLLGTPSLELLQQRFSQFIRPQDQDLYYLFCMDALEVRAVRTCELQLFKKNEAAFDVSLIGRAVRNHLGEKVLNIVFSDVAKRKLIEAEVQDAKEFAENIVETVREPLLVLSAKLCVLSANQSFYSTFKVTPDETIGYFIYDLGNRQWNIPKLRVLFEEILPRSSLFSGYEVEHDFPGLGRRTIVLNAREMVQTRVGTKIILLAMEDITERKRAEELVRQLAYYDPLTKLANRELLKDRLLQSMQAGQRSTRYGALIFLDLDNFKSLNDTQGHGAGDLLLIEVAVRLKACVRRIDSVARFGGDEFVVLLNDLPSDRTLARTQAELVAEKIRIVLGNPYVLQPATGEGSATRCLIHNCTASIGVVLFKGQDNSHDEVLKWADLAMYKAKDADRNTVCFFDSVMHIENSNRVFFEDDLREAVLKKQFLVYYQAQINGQGEITGVEALLRWKHSTRGWVSPAEFIPKAEKTGLILPLGLWVLEAACTQLALWALCPETAHLTMAINVAARQFHQGEFVNQVLAVIGRTGAKPERIKLELTESFLLADIDVVTAKMKLLKATGVSFSLDDFGTGYSSLTYLKRLPLAQLKIAQEFVRDILTNPDDAAIAGMVVALSKSMGLEVIAEGVETETQRDFLAGLGCHNYQGYLFSQALPVQEFEKLMQQRSPSFAPSSKGSLLGC